MTNDSTFPPGKLPLEYLNSLLAAYQNDDPRVVAGAAVGQDVAVVDMGDRYLVVKTDPITFATDQIGWYAVHVNANDVATSGARPMWMLNTVLLPEGQATPALVEAIFAQLRAACGALGIVMVGGHTEVALGIDHPVVVGVMIGEVERDRLHLTTHARTGDSVLLVKGIPIEGTALIARERRSDLLARGYDPAWLDRASDLLFDPGISVVDAANLAAGHPGVHAMHDPTEGGLATGLHELAYAAGSGVTLYREKVNVLPEGATLCATYGLDPLGLIASGALLVTVEPADRDSLLARYEAAGIACSHIADLVPAGEGCTIVDAAGRRPLPRFDADEITRALKR